MIQQFECFFEREETARSITLSSDPGHRGLPLCPEVRHWRIELSSQFLAGQLFSLFITHDFSAFIVEKSGEKRPLMRKYVRDCLNASISWDLTHLSRN
jgi:hypothetical protein